MDTLNPNIPTSELARLMTTAVSLQSQYNLRLLTPQLLLRVFMDDEKCTAHKILRQLQRQRGFDWDDLSRRVEMMARSNKGQDARFNFTDDFGKDAPLDEYMLVVIDEALSIAQSREELKAGSGHALAAMAQSSVTTYGVLNKMGVSAAAIIALLGEIAQDGTPLIHDYVDEAKKGMATAVYQRTDLLRDLLGLLSLSRKRHVILVGQEGAGRRTLAYSLAQLIAEGKAGGDLRSLAAMNETALLENDLAAMRSGLRRASGGILLVPRIERFFAGRLKTQFKQQVSRDLQKALLGNEQAIIGTTTAGAYNKLAQNPIIRQNTQRLDVPAATKAEAVAMLAFHKQRLEQEYEIEVSREGLETAVSIADQYMKSIALPAAAVQLANRACALVKMGADELFPSAIAADNALSPDDVMIAASQMTKIPITKLGEDEQAKYANMDEQLHRRIIGQDEAVTAVSRAVKTARVGLRAPKRPIGSFLFLGPSGVGKTELAKALAEFMFGDEKAMLVLDMSEYQEEASVNRLIGAPPGYVGYAEGGQLTNFVRERPYTVVLFDEIEKAHAKVFDVLLQVMEEGRLTDNQGRTTTFSETVVIMTSKLGARHMLVPVIGEQERAMAMEAVHEFLRPEFLNRLDDVIMFHQLAGAELAKILDLMLKKELELAAGQGIDLDITRPAREWILAQNDQPEYGARPLRRLIARHLREPLADFLLSQKRANEVKIVVGVGNDGLIFGVK